MLASNFRHVSCFDSQTLLGNSTSLNCHAGPSTIRHQSRSLNSEQLVPCLKVVCSNAMKTSKDIYSFTSENVVSNKPSQTPRHQPKSTDQTNLRSFGPRHAYCREFTCSRGWAGRTDGPTPTWHMSLQSS